MRILKNEQGFISLVVVFSVVAIGSLIVIQISTAFRTNQMQNRHNRVQANSHLHLIDLAQQFKRGYDLAEIARSSGQNCTGMGASLAEKNLPGHTASTPRTICHKAGGAICITDPNIVGNSNQICASLNDNKINWRQMGFSVAAVPIQSLSQPSSGSPSSLSRQTQITVPATTNNIWKDCNGASCVRIVMCPAGRTTCQDNEITGVQTVMFGN